jgi:hypothetical protein
VDRPRRRVRRGVRIRPVYLPGAFHEGDDGRHLLKAVRTPSSPSGSR